MEEKPKRESQVAREDPSALSARTGMPAFMAPPDGAPAYYGFPLLPNSEKDGFVFGAITRSRVGTAASWGDAYVVAPDGSRAGIVWVTDGPVTEMVLPPEPTRWGVYQFRFEQPVATDADLVRNLHAILPRLKELYETAKSMSVELSRLSPLIYDDVKSEFAVLTSLGEKIGIPKLATQDFDLVYANAQAVGRFCDQFESIDFLPKERFYFMQLIVASLDEALRSALASAPQTEQRVERLLMRDVANYRYIVDYWGRSGEDIDLRVAPMMHRVRSGLHE